MSIKKISDSTLQKGVEQLEKDLSKDDSFLNIRFISWNDPDSNSDSLLELNVEDEKGRTKKFLILNNHKEALYKFHIPENTLNNVEQRARQQLKKDIIKWIKDPSHITRFEGL